MIKKNERQLIVYLSLLGGFFLILVNGVVGCGGAADTDEEESSEEDTQTTGTTVTPQEGGSVVSTDGLLTIEVPPGAVTVSTEISILEVAEVGAVGGMAYELSPDGLSFQIPVTARFQYTTSDYTSEQGVATGVPLVQNDDGLYEILGGAVTEIDLILGTVETSGTLEHFSLVINTNVASLVAERQLNRAQQTLAKSFERLSSGIRISTSAEDASGLAMSEQWSISLSTSDAVDTTVIFESFSGGLTDEVVQFQTIIPLTISAISAEGETTSLGSAEFRITDQVSCEVSLTSI